MDIVSILRNELGELQAGDKLEAHLEDAARRDPPAARILAKAAQTHRERHAVYGDNYRMVGKIMAVLFPEGVKLKTEADHNRFHILMLVVVKLTRYATNWRSGGHRDSLTDLSAYAAMLEAIDEELEKGDG